jgi:hypothetical protein
MVEGQAEPVGEQGLMQRRMTGRQRDWLGRRVPVRVEVLEPGAGNVDRVIHGGRNSFGQQVEGMPRESGEGLDQHALSATRQNNLPNIRERLRRSSEWATRAPSGAVSMDIGATKASAAKLTRPTV